MSSPFPPVAGSPRSSSACCSVGICRCASIELTASSAASSRLARCSSSFDSSRCSSGAPSVLASCSRSREVHASVLACLASVSTSKTLPAGLLRGAPRILLAPKAVERGGTNGVAVLRLGEACRSNKCCCCCRRSSRSSLAEARGESPQSERSPRSAFSASSADDRSAPTAVPLRSRHWRLGIKYSHT